MRAVQILVAVLFAVTATGCGGSSPELRLGRLTVAELLASETIAAARTGRVRVSGEREAEGRRYRVARVSLLGRGSGVMSLRGRSRGRSKRLPPRAAVWKGWPSRPDAADAVRFAQP